jgi:hypothetical protein
MELIVIFNLLTYALNRNVWFVQQNINVLSLQTEKNRITISILCINYLSKAMKTCEGLEV